MGKVVYCVEDDSNIRELVVYALNSSGFVAQGFEDGKTFRAGIEKVLPDIILMDIMLPDEDGISLLKYLKKGMDTSEIPVILLTAKASEYDKVRGLDLGADDYITTPFSVMELSSRIRAVLRRSKGRVEEELLNIGEITLDNVHHRVLVGGDEITLTYKEFELLYYLMKNRSIVLTRDKLLSAVWNMDYEGESRTVDVHIGSLRQKLKTSGSRIQTVRGIGYRLD